MALNNGWNERLKKKRKEAGFTLTSAAGNAEDSDYISRQTLTSYEKGDTFPDLANLSILCEKYHTSADYILFGTNESTSLFLDSADTLTCLFMLMHSKMISCDMRGNVEVLNEGLKDQMIVLRSMLEGVDLSNVKIMLQTLKAIKKLSKEMRW